MQNSTFTKILILCVVAFAVSATKAWIGSIRDTNSRENFHAYIRQLKQQRDFTSFDYWLGLSINNSGKTVQMINSGLKEEAREYSRKMSKRLSLGKEAGYYASLRNDVEKLYNAFKNSEFYYEPDFPTNNLDRLLVGF